MSTPRRVTGIVLMVLSVTMAFLSVAGVVATWQLNGALSTGFDNMFGTLDTALETADSGLLVIDTRVDDARERVDEFDQLVMEVGDQLLEQPLLLNALAEQLDVDAEPLIRSVLESVKSIREVAEGFDQAREELSEAKEGAVDGVTSSLGQASDRIDSGLEEIQSAVGDHRDRLESQRAEMRALQDRIQRWLTIVGIIATVSLGWILLSQAAMFVFGLSLYRGENLFDRWLATQDPPSEVA